MIPCIPWRNHRIFDVACKDTAYAMKYSFAFARTKRKKKLKTVTLNKVIHTNRVSRINNIDENTSLRIEIFKLI